MAELDTGALVTDHGGGTRADWYVPRDLTVEQREVFRQSSLRARSRKAAAAMGEGSAPLHDIAVARLDPLHLMPSFAPSGLRALSLFSGGGGLDLGLERAGFAHVASYDWLEAAGATLRANRPDWVVHAGADGDVQAVDWTQYRGSVDVVHGGPPCQPFSAAGRQRGAGDGRNMVPEFVRAVHQVQPQAFIMENVAALGGPKFAPYLQEEFFGPLASEYEVRVSILSASAFGVPQIRRRYIAVGVRRDAALRPFDFPAATHRVDHLRDLPRGTVHHPQAPGRTMGVREALGLPDSGYDALAPTLRSTLTGPRHTTSVLSSASAQRKWAALGVWPNGVAKTRAAAREFVPENGHFRMSVADCKVLQGFPEDWFFSGATYMALGQLGNSVAPPVGYRLGLAVSAVFE